MIWCQKMEQKNSHKCYTFLNNVRKKKKKVGNDYFRGFFMTVA